jgi:hypothetical protein
MTPEEFAQINADVVSRMAAHVAPFVTPITHALDDQNGLLEGTGSYVNTSTGIHLVTCEHVTNKPDLTHQFHGCPDIFKVTAPWFPLRFPFDFAKAEISQSVWTSRAHQAAAIPISRMAPSHAPVQGELLFFLGFSQDRSRPFTGLIINPATPVLGQEVIPELDEEPFSPHHAYDPNFHFVMGYNPGRATRTDGDTRPAPAPPGFSGSLVWNTRRMERWMRGEEWSPEDALVTGMVWGWNQEPYLYATRVEYILALMRA